jgi:predicted nucleotidyltransferase
MNIAQENIDLLVKAVAESAHPLRIILFGSAAKERNTSESDIDLLVIMPNGVHRRKTAQAIYRTVRIVGVPYDIVVATPDDIERHRNNKGLIYHTALSDGKEVYVK